MNQSESDKSMQSAAAMTTLTAVGTGAVYLYSIAAMIRLTVIPTAVPAMDLCA